MKAVLAKIVAVLVLVALTFPIVIGYGWVVIATFSTRIFGLKPVDAEGKLGGLTLENWAFLKDKEIWRTAANSLTLAIGITLGTIFVASTAGYALSRVKFPGRKVFLQTALVLHAFPAITLLIGLYFVLRFMSNIPILGKGVPVVGGLGYNTLGGVILISVGFQLPLGIWLMKGFFDNLSWDLECAALIDGCSRFRAWRQILLPQIQPGIAALSILSFISGWNEFLIPYIFLISQKNVVIATYLMGLLNEKTPAGYNVVAAVGLFQLFPILIFFIFNQKYLLRIFSGGIKGTT
jgi:inositol-phosphate transport system permease protein